MIELDGHVCEVCDEPISWNGEAWVHDFTCCIGDPAAMHHSHDVDTDHDVEHSCGDPA